MPRPLRLEHPGVWYHITARGNARQRIFWDQRDRVHLRELLEEAVTRFRLRLFAYVFMANHYHLMLAVPPGNLSRAMQWLNVSYSALRTRLHAAAQVSRQQRLPKTIDEGPFAAFNAVCRPIRPHGR